LSVAIQDYLKAIYKLQSAQGRVSTSALADEMGVKAPSVTSMIKSLAELGLLRYDRYHGVELTEAGARTALEVIRHHRLWELFLSEALRVPLEQLHVEAERLEHDLSEELEERIDRALGYPTVDPHGDPIPTKDLAVPADDSCGLDAVPAGQVVTVRRVPDGDAALLRYLGELGLLPGRQARVAERAPYGGTLFVETEAGRRALGNDLAARIKVELTAPAAASGGAPEAGSPS
jgi:DtxR family Mn-dependent transcriptional regulator